MIEKLRNVVNRNIFKYACESQIFSHVQFKFLRKAYNKEVRKAIKLENNYIFDVINNLELAFILSDLISKGYIKCSLSLETKSIELDKSNAFPKLKTVITRNKNKI